MIYLVSTQAELFEKDSYKCISIQESLDIMNSWIIVQYDSETSGRDPHICKLLCAQFGNANGDIQIVVDCTTIDIKLYKDILETKCIIGHNLKFDLQFLYNYSIIPRKVYDTMIVEQLLYLGYPSGQVLYSLKEVAARRLGKNIDKTVRGEIIWRGLDEKVILYAAGDVVYLNAIMRLQVSDCRQRNCIVGAKLECDFIPAIAYLEWCGIKLDIDKWKAKMIRDKEQLTIAKKALNDFIIKLSDEGYKCPFKDGMGKLFYQDVPATKFKKFVFIDRQGDLFTGFNTEPQVTVNWSSNQQVVEIAKLLGFNTTVKDKKTGEDKDSVLEKHLSTQKGICDEFLKLYFTYQEHAKVVSSFGQGHLNAINPNTGRLHTVFKQLGATSSRMSCGSQQPNTDLAKLKHLNPSECTYPNIQQLPSDAVTRGCFIASPGNLLADCDYSALESRLGADIYNEKSMLEEFLHGSGDMHSLCAKMVFHEELKDVDVKDVKVKRPDLRKKVKPIEFSQQFGGSEYAIASSLGCSIEEALKFKQAYDSGFKGIAEFKKKGSKFVREHGYILMNKYTGHKMYWWDFENWKKEQEKYTSEFWDEYKAKHKNTGDYVEQEVRRHFKAAAKWDRMALNAPTQCTGCNCIKTAATDLFNWIVDNHLFGKVLICAIVHDELLIEFPKELVDSFPKKLEDIMLNGAAKFCKSLPIPAEAEVGDHWIH